MGKSRFLNQKLGKRMRPKFGQLKSVLGSRRLTPPATTARLPKKGNSREKLPSA